MLEVTKVKMSGTEKKVNRKTYNISSMKPMTRKVHVVVMQKKKKQQRNVQKTVLHVQSCFFFVANCCLFYPSHYLHLLL